MRGRNQTVSHVLEPKYFFIIGSFNPFSQKARTISSSADNRIFLLSVRSWRLIITHLSYHPTVCSRHLIESLQGHSANSTGWQLDTFGIRSGSSTLPNYVATRSGDKSPNFKNKDRTVSDVTFRCSDIFGSFKRDTWSTSLQRVKNAFGSSSF